MGATTPITPLAPPPGGAPVARRSRTARACDALLTFCVLVLAAWTLAYHACLVLGLGSSWALAVLAAGLVPCGLLATRYEAGSAPVRGAGRRPPDTPAPPLSGGRAPTPPMRAGAVGVGLALAAAAALAFAPLPWPRTWALWTAAACVVLLAAARGPLVSAERRGSRSTASCRCRGTRSREAAPVALAWAASLAALTLFLVKPNVDDLYYVRQAAWIAEYGRFPLGDTLHSHDTLPAVFSPPLPSFEPLVGAVAGLAGVTPLGLAHLVVAPVVAALAALALWRLLRTWQVRLVAPALTVALLFLLTALEPASDPRGAIPHLPGDFFVTRAWQGKVALEVVLVPLLLSLLHDHAAQRRRGSLALLSAAGAAAVGLSTTGAFLVPVIAVACLASVAIRAPRRAVAGAVAASAYPLGAMVAALVSDARQPAEWRPEHIAPEVLVVPAMGHGLLAFVALAAALVAPLLLVPPHARLGLAAVALAVALAFAPGLPLLIHDLTGLGRPLWRLLWAMPLAALLGVAVTQPAAWQRNAAVRLLPALAVGTLVALAGTPVWEGRGTELAGHPAIKRDPGQLASASRLSHAARPGDVVLAPPGLSSTLLMLDGRVTGVAPRLFYTRSLPASPAVKLPERLLLWAFVNQGLSPAVREDAVTTALRRLRVDIACVRERAMRGQQLLAHAGYRPLVLGRGFWCGADR
jgi:hypothetical protein